MEAINTRKKADRPKHNPFCGDTKYIPVKEVTTMPDININCHPCLTEEHLLQLHAALMNEEPGSKFSMSIDTDDNSYVPRILNLISESDWNGNAEPMQDKILISAQRKN